MKIRNLVCAVSGLFLSAMAANAATVSFSASSIDPSSTDFLDTSGTVLSAVNFAPANSETYSSTNPDTAVTLSGITFTPVSTTSAASGTYFTTNSSNRDSNRISNVTYDNTELYGLVYYGLITGSNSTNMQFNLTNLTVGQSYLVQFIYSCSGNRPIQLAAGTFSVGSVATSGTGSDGNSDVYSYGETNGALLLTATFTADSTTELFTMLSNTTGSNSRVTLSGFVISEIPEPSVALLGALGGLALISRRRRA
ncbi:hypothetical protein [Luteolibacter pohnpeiensis]|uniref:hypothetical protein n=1 Tax=Luteolibacter pohnpeiensis TaxID=454153 RepID=UPI001F300933|nr:hypothetical protein [Luteolibacter pohnpeiensis]